MMNFKHQIANNNKLIVFIHGFMGSEKTWENTYINRKLYDFLLENNEIKENFDMALFTYDKCTSFFKSTPISHLVEFLDSEMKSKCYKYKKIILVGHSLGGIIAKDYILNYRNNVCLYFSVNSPHNGNSFLLSKILFFNNQVKNLFSNSKYLKKLDEKYRLSNEFPKSYFVYGLRDIIVKRNYAIPSSVRNENIIAIDTDHTGVVKPSDNNDSLLSLLSKELVDLVEKKLALQNFSFTKISVKNESDFENCKEVESISEEEILRIFNFDTINKGLRDKERFELYLIEHQIKLNDYREKYTTVSFLGIPLIPLAVFEGFHLKSLDKKYFAHNRSNPGIFYELKDNLSDINFSYEIDNLGYNEKEIFILVDCSYEVNRQRVRELNKRNLPIIEFTSNVIDINVIDSYDTLSKFKKEFKDMMDNLSQKNVKKFHLFLGVPISVAFALGNLLEHHHGDIVIYNLSGTDYNWSLDLFNNKVMKLVLN